jgi:hypothetical protein
MIKALRQIDDTSRPTPPTAPGTPRESS